MFDGRNVLQHRCGTWEILAGRNCTKMRKIFGAFLEVELLKVCTTLWRESDLEVKTIKNWRFWTFKLRFAAGAGVRQGCKDVGRRGGFQEGPKRCFLRSRRRMPGFVMSTFEAPDAESAEGIGRVASFVSWKCYSAGIIWCGNYRISYASAQLFPGRRSTFEASIKKNIYCNSEVGQASGRHVIFAEKLRFWASKLHFWRSLAKKLRFWVSKLHFLIEVSQKKFRFWASTSFLNFCFELQGYFFSGRCVTKTNETAGVWSHRSIFVHLGCMFLVLLMLMDSDCMFSAYPTFTVGELELGSDSTTNTTASRNTSTQHQHSELFNFGLIIE